MHICERITSEIGGLQLHTITLSYRLCCCRMNIGTDYISHLTNMADATEETMADKNNRDSRMKTKTILQYLTARGQCCRIELEMSFILNTIQSMFTAFQFNRSLSSTCLTLRELY